MMNLKNIAAGVAVAGTLGFAALGIGAGVANAAPSTVSPGPAWAQDAGWDHGPGPGWRGPGWDGPRYAPGDYGYGGYGYGGYGYDGYGGPACVSGPLGLLHLCT
jgi:hypothetical protein